MASKPFGSLTPFGENAWARGLPSPFYTASHTALRAELRDLLDEVDFQGNAHEWSEAGEVDPTLYKQVAKLGIVA